MNGVSAFFSTLAFAWLAYAGYRLWGGTASNTAKWVGVGLVGLLALGLAQDLLSVRRGDPAQSFDSGVQQVVEVRGDKMCIGCVTENHDGKYVLQGNWIAGELKLKPLGTQPFALSFERGSVNLDDSAMQQGCTVREIGDETVLQISGARRLRLEIGPGASCTK